MSWKAAKSAIDSEAEVRLFVLYRWKQTVRYRPKSSQAGSRRVLIQHYSSGSQYLPECPQYRNSG